MIGAEFGRLIVINEVSERNKNGHILYLCRCECGTEKEILGASLRQGLTSSCGCNHKSAITRHNMDGTPIYKIWVGMRNRCNNPRNPAYPSYGGRGISVCERWNKSFEKFYEDMGDRPDKKSIDRIDVNGNYEPSNCRWATSKQQMYNRRNTILVVIEGNYLNVEEYAKLIGLTKSGAAKRINREFKKFGNIFIKESDPVYAQVIAEIEGNYNA